jgi:hypothetical protein
MLVSGSFVSLSAVHDSKVTDLGKNTHAENRSSTLYKAVDCFKHINDSKLFDVNRSIINITPPEVLINESVNNNSSDSNISNNDTSFIDNDDSSVENVTEQVVVPSRNLVTVIAWPSAIGDLDRYSYAPYYVTWDMDIVNNIYGTCVYNNKGTWEGEWTVVASGRYNDVDLSGLTGREKVQSGKSGSYFKDISSGIVGVERCYNYVGAQVV